MPDFITTLTFFWEELVLWQKVLFIFLLLILAHWIYRQIRYGDLRHWLPIAYMGEFKDSLDKPIKEKDTIPPNEPVLLVIPRLRSGYKLIRIIDTISEFITCGVIRFHEIIPVDKPFKLKLFLRNISVDSRFTIPEQIIELFIVYPGDNLIRNEIKTSGHPSNSLTIVKASRNWRITIPELRQGESKTLTFDNFFAPEVPGDYQMFLQNIKSVRFAGMYGLLGRKYMIIGEDNLWRQLFHVSNQYEYKIFIVVFMSFVIALASLLISLLAILTK